MKGLIPLLTIYSLLLSSCVQNSGGAKRKVASEEDLIGDLKGGSGGNGQGTIPVPGIDLTSGGTTVDAQSEITYIVDPFDGSYKSKVTIPRNFTGLLYLAGLNLAPLRERFFSVRFNFGKDYAPVTISNAYIGRPGKGITPQTNTDVIIMDMVGTPFLNVRLFYNLFDYNDYRDGVGLETKEPTSDPRNSGLYCRGLDLQYDPTFQSSVSNPGCDAAGEKCLYTYAKIEDVNLFNGTEPILPTQRQMDLGGTGYANESFATNQTKCLPDSLNFNAFNTVMNPVAPLAGLAYNTPVGALTYFGPYRTLNDSIWGISGAAIFSQVNLATPPTGIFQQAFDAIQDIPDLNGIPNNLGYQSLMFPRAGKFKNQRAGVEYIKLSTDLTDDSRTRESLVTDADSALVDGCNLRKAFVNEDSEVKEDISSCNVTATIEIIGTDSSGVEEILVSSRDLKLQLVKPSQIDYKGEEVLYSALKTCTDSRACGGSECCYNNRCWDKGIVGQCLEEVPSIGNGGTGDLCSSDYECSSFCCDSSRGGVCSEHINTETEKVLCNKSSGQTCVSKEFCRMENVRDCRIINTGFDAQGKTTCSLICYNVPTFGNCINGSCKPPVTPPIPAFDSANPDCTNAVDPPIIE